jgi:hypothetical protein
MKGLRLFPALLVLLAVLPGLSVNASAAIPLRISIKFILDANGNRPVVGNLHTNTQINAEVDAGSDILARNVTEYRLDLLELVDVSGISKYYTTSAADDAGVDQLRADAISNPTLYKWRSDAVNIYINAGPSSAVSRFPPNNNIIVMNQGCSNTPSCILHELGHSMNLMHTHETCCSLADECADTITDNKNWTKDQVSQANFGASYANLTQAQKNKVNMVWNNIMSYHVDEPQVIITPCQMNRVSTQGYTDRNRLLSQLPIYVNSGYIGSSPAGSFTDPYKNVQDALPVAALLPGAALVIQSGNYTVTQSGVSSITDIVTRSGSSVIDHGFQAWKLPVDLENSSVPEVRKTVKVAQDEDTASRGIERAAEERAEKAASLTEKAAIRSEAEKLAKPHREKARQMLEEAEDHASGDEKLAIQFELARRFSETGDCVNAARYYMLVAGGTDQENLRKEAIHRAGDCQETPKALQPGTDGNQPK